MKSWEEHTWRRKRRSCSDVEGVMADLSVFVCFSPFPYVLCLRLSLVFFPRLRPSLSLLVLASVFSNMKVVELQLS